MSKCGDYIDRAGDSLLHAEEAALKANDKDLADDLYKLRFMLITISHRHRHDEDIRNNSPLEAIRESLRSKS